MKKMVILAMTLVLAALPALGTDGAYIVKINHTNGMFQLSDRTYWRTLRPREVLRWQEGDDVTGAHSASCGNDPNMYLLTDTNKSESACAQRIGR